MKKPQFSFSPPIPAGSPSYEELLEKIRTLEKEVLLLRRKLEGKPPEKPMPLRSTIKEVRPAAEGALLESVDLGNIRVIQLLMDWVTFILSKVGKERFQEVIDYYRNIRWISDEVAEVLRAYAEGLNVEGEGMMLPEDHMKSLEYISRIKEEMA